jgi:hypothetical protein
VCASGELDMATRFALADAVRAAITLLPSRVAVDLAEVTCHRLVGHRRSARGVPVRARSERQVLDRAAHGVPGASRRRDHPDRRPVRSAIARSRLATIGDAVTGYRLRRPSECAGPSGPEAPSHTAWRGGADGGDDVAPRRSRWAVVNDVGNEHRSRLAVGCAVRSSPTPRVNGLGCPRGAVASCLHRSFIT